MLSIPQSAAVLKALAAQVSKRNEKKEPITDDELESLETCFDIVLQSFKKLADFKKEHSKTITVLRELPAN